MESLPSYRNMNPINRSYDYLFKLIIVGDSCVGKTSILQRYHGEIFRPVAIPTIGIDFRIRTITLQNKVIKLQIWDTSGQEKFDSITTSYYRGAMGVLLVYDITNYKSFDNIKSRWLKHVNAFAKEGVKIVLIGNKCDVNNKREVDKKMAETMATEHGLKYFETSAKENINLEEAFNEISKDIFNEKNLMNDEKTVTSLTQPKDNIKGRSYRCCQINIT